MKKLQYFIADHPWPDVEKLHGEEQAKWVTAERLYMNVRMSTVEVLMARPEIQCGMQAMGNPDVVVFPFPLPLYTFGPEIVWHPTHDLIHQSYVTLYNWATAMGIPCVTAYATSHVPYGQNIDVTFVRIVPVGPYKAFKMVYDDMDVIKTIYNRVNKITESSINQSDNIVLLL